MKDYELERILKNRVGQGSFSPSSFIKTHWGIGFAYLVGENISHAWQSGDVMVLWKDGDVTVLPEDFEVIVEDGWDI